MFKKFVVAFVLIAMFVSMSASAYQVTMHAPDGRTEYVQDYDVAAWKAVGWVDDSQRITVYAYDGRTCSIPVNQFALYAAVGWYSEPFIDMYSLDGRMTRVLQSEAPAYSQVGWYYEPVVQLYSADGRRIIAELDRAYEYSQVGWYTLADFLLYNNFSAIKNQFGNFTYQYYYPGTPNSGDIPMTFYQTTYPMYIKLGINSNYAAHVEVKLADAFPYLKMYADANGYISTADLNDALNDWGMYGYGYRTTDVYGPYADFSRFQYFTGYYDRLYGEFNGTGVSISSDAYGYVNINYSTCVFYITV